MYKSVFFCVTSDSNFDVCAFTYLWLGLEAAPGVGDIHELSRGKSCRVVLEEFLLGVSEHNARGGSILEVGEKGELFKVDLF